MASDWLGKRHAEYYLEQVGKSVVGFRDFCGFLVGFLVQASNDSYDLWISMGFYGFLCVSMGFYAFLLESYVFRWFMISAKVGSIGFFRPGWCCFPHGAVMSSQLTAVPKACAVQVENRNLNITWQACGCVPPPNLTPTDVISKIQQNTYSFDSENMFPKRSWSPKNKINRSTGQLLPCFHQRPRCIAATAACGVWPCTTSPTSSSRAAVGGCPWHPVANQW